MLNLPLVEQLLYILFQKQISQLHLYRSLSIVPSYQDHLRIMQTEYNIFLLPYLQQNQSHTVFFFFAFNIFNNFNNANIYRIPTDYQFIINDIFHYMRFFLLSEINLFFLYPTRYKIVTKQIKQKITFSTDLPLQIKTYCTFSLSFNSL